MASAANCFCKVLELYISYSDGDGQWSPPACLTDNKSKASSFYKETVGGKGVGNSVDYTPKYASVVLGPDQKPGMLAVIVENTLIGLSSSGVTSSGRTVVSTGTARVDDPAVFFLKP